MATSGGKWPIQNRAIVQREVFLHYVSDMALLGCVCSGGAAAMLLSILEMNLIFPDYAVT
jgi:hypothetical protein